MIFIKEDRDEVSRKRVVLPKSFIDFRKKQAKLTPERYMNTLDGGKTLKSDASDKEYNERKDTDRNGTGTNANTLSVSDAKVRKSRMQHLDRKSLEYQLYGGQEAEKLYGDIARRARAQAPVSEVPAVAAPTTRNVPKVDKVDSVKSAAVKECRRVIHLKNNDLKILR